MTARVITLYNRDDSSLATSAGNISEVAHYKQDRQVMLTVYMTDNFLDGEVSPGQQRRVLIYSDDNLDLEPGDVHIGNYTEGQEVLRRLGI